MKSSNINDRAAEWVLKNDRGLSAAEQDAFIDWLGASTKHREAYAAYNHAWDDLARLAGLQNTKYAPVVPDLLGIDNPPWYQKYSKWTVMLPIAASFLFFVGYFMLHQFGDGQLSTEADQAVVVNHIKKLELDDGSVVDLNEGAAVEVHYSRDERLVKLISGEANFTVQKDPSRPFIVEVSGVRLRAVGTVFNVRMEAQKVDVIVTEGVVAVQHTYLDSGTHPAVDKESFVAENFRAVVDLESETPQVSVNPIKTLDLDTELLWLPRLIDFDDVPLSQIVEEFNRRNPLRIEIQDDEIRSLRFTSIFWSNNVKSFVRLLEANYGISAEVVSPKEIVLKKAQTAL